MTAAKIGKIDETSCGSLRWINIEKPGQKELEFLASNYSFHPLALEDCISKIQLPKIDRYRDYIFIILHFPCLKDGGKLVAPSQLSIFLGKNYIITIHQGDIQPLTDLFRRCKEDEQTRGAIICNSVGYTFYRLLDTLVDAFFPILDYVLRELDEIEDIVFDEKVEAVREVTLLRRKIADLRRITFPLKRIVSELARDVNRFSTFDLTTYFEDIQDHIDKVWETLEECKETIEIYKDTDFMLNTEKTNKILAILTILFTLSIPATVVGTIYGMNINLPGGVETGPWDFLGTYTTLIILLILSIIPALLMLWYFRRVGWI
ncbi:MAG: magnesium transporter CorA family protein [Nitrososphaerales archaeon]